jgi:hypothetical protein
MQETLIHIILQGSGAPARCAIFGAARILYTRVPQEFSLVAERPNQWIADFTYIWTAED